MRLASLPIGIFGAVMGLAGLGLTARAAAPLFPGVFRAPAYFTELWIALGCLAFALLSILYFFKIVLHWKAVREELSHPLVTGFRAALPVGATLVAGGLAPYSPGVAGPLWWAGVILLVALQAWTLILIALGRVSLREVNPGWLILFVGGIVVPGPGVALGYADAARVIFSASALAAPVIYVLLFLRARRGPLPEPMRPSWLILLVPPSLIFANGRSMYPDLPLEWLYLVAVAAFVALLWYARRLFRWPFSPLWWSLTFPLDAFALAAARYAQTSALPAWKALAGFSLVLATLVVSFVLLKSLHSLVATRRSAASPGA